MTLSSDLSDDPRARNFSAKHLLGEELRLLDKTARLGLNFSKPAWRIPHFETARPHV
ncbi:hypothetical protein BRAS3843_1330084 [Bradyrhizobium sp. STM 3843]|nr:hypothetical protein BRAS3843_1330084 [Bradyrhizobium sp. STM 3843]